MPAALAAPGATPVSRPGFIGGLRALLGGVAFIVTTPSVWLLALVPIAIVCVVAGGLGAAAVAIVPAKIAASIGATSSIGRAGAWVLTALAIIVAVVASLLVGFAVAQPLSGPALNGIVRRVDARLGVPAAVPTTFGQDMLRGLASVALAACVGVPLLGVLFAVSFFFPPANVVTFPLKILVVTVLVSWDLCDYPLSVRGVPIAGRLRFMGRNFTAILGFGVALAFVSLVPFALLLLLPAGVAGAARLTALCDQAGLGEP